MSARVRIGINGFGRIGRLALRAGWERPDLHFVHVNEPVGDAETCAHLLEFDSVHGRWPRRIAALDDALEVDGTRLTTSRCDSPGAVPWGELGVDLVLECSGRFRTEETLAPCFGRGVSKVVVAAPVRSAGALNVVVGVNDDRYDPGRHDIVTAASCTTNCLAPVVKVIHEGIGIRHGSITTLHDMTNTQTVVDAPHRDLRRARAASLSLIPTTTGSASAIGLIFPELEGRLNGLAVRVPLLNASLTDCVFEVERATTVEEVNALLRAAAEGPLAGVLGYEERPLVSVDFKDDPRSAIVDALSTMVVGETQVKVLAWYDNEWGYANRLVELAALVGAARAPERPRERCGRERARGRPAQLRDRDRGLLGGHGHRRSDPHARPVLLLRARLLALRGRVAVPLLRALRHRDESRRRLARRAARAEGDARDGPLGADRRARHARARPRRVARRALRDGLAGALGHREGPHQDELEERGQARRAGGLERHALPLGRDPHGLEERAQGRRLLPRRACS